MTPKLLEITERIEYHAERLKSLNARLAVTSLGDEELEVITHAIMELKDDIDSDLVALKSETAVSQMRTMDQCGGHGGDAFE